MLRITNTQKGPRGINAVSGPALINPDQTVEVEVYEREKQHIETAGWFTVKGSYTPNPDGGTVAPQIANQDAIDKAVADAKAEADKAAAEKDAEIAELKKQLAAQTVTPPALKAEHRGGGNFGVTDGETVHLSGLSKADADAFNAMSAEDRAAYLAAEKAKA